MKSDTKLILIHIITCFIMILLSFFCLIFSNWEIVVCVSIGSLTAIAYFLSLLKGASSINPQSSEKGWGVFLLFTILRFVLVIIGVGVSYLIIYFTGDNKMRYLNVLTSLLPLLSVNIILMICRKDVK